MQINWRLLQVCEASSAGVGRHVVDLCRWLAGNGHEVHLAWSPLRSDGAFRSAIAGFTNSATVCCHSIPMLREPALADHSAIRSLRHITKMHGPFDIIHAHSTKAGFLSRIGLIGCRGAHIYTPHAPITMDAQRSRAFRTAATATELALSLRNKRIIAVSSEEHRHLASIGVSSQRLALVPNGIDLHSAQRSDEHRRSWRTKLRLRDSEVCVGFIGRLQQQKNPHLLLNAFAQAVGDSAIRGLKLVIVGQGDLGPELRTMARKLGVADSVAWVDEWVHVPAVMAAFDIFAMSSRFEGLPYVLLEAMAQGLPAVVTNVGGVAELVADNSNGYVIPEGNGESFAAALKRLAQNPMARNEMGRRSLAAVKAYSIDKMGQSISEVYKRCRLHLHTTSVSQSPEVPNACHLH